MAAVYDIICVCIDAGPSRGQHVREHGALLWQTVSLHTSLKQTNVSVTTTTEETTTQRVVVVVEGAP